MPIFLFTLLILFSNCYLQAQALEAVPEIVRVRIFKDLEQFPQILNAELKQIKKNVWSLNGSELNYLGKSLPSQNVVLQKSNGKFDLVSVLEFNEYLAGVVSNEMPLSWTLEALKAQAVVARSFALARLAERKNHYFHLESDHNDQVFSMTGSPKAARAVFETDRVILFQPNGKVLKAYYHADCGGKTVKATDVWGSKSFDSGTAEDPWCANREKSKWSYELPKKDFAEQLSLSSSALVGFAVPAKNQFIEFGHRFFSVQNLRQLLGFAKLRSSIDKVEIGLDTVKFSGRGFGHGVGLCQWGTHDLADRGLDYRSILKHYYPKAKLTEAPVRIGLNSIKKQPLAVVSN